MGSKSIIPQNSNFYLYSLTLSLSSVIITLIITIKLYIWNNRLKPEDKSSLNYFFIENHPFIMTAVLLLIGFSILVPRICTDYQMKPLFTILIHGLLNGTAIVLSLGPTYTLISGLFGSKIAQHFYSIHCWYGAIAILLCLVQFLGAVFYYSISSFGTLPEFIIKGFSSFHKNLGHIAFGLIGISLVLGICEQNYSYSEQFPDKYDYPMLLTNVLALSVLFFCLIVVYVVFARLRLETAMTTIRSIRKSEKQRFVSRVVEKQEKNNNRK